MPGRAVNTEVDAYVFIKNTLKDLGWDVRNPQRNPAGQVYTQNECLSNPEIKQAFVLDRPESVVKIAEDVYWVIEAKREQRQLAQAVTEAEDYACRINQSSRNIKALFISGVAGNQTDSFLIQTRSLVDGHFQPVTMNGQVISSLISPEIARTVLEGGPDIKDVQIDESLFFQTAERINQTLHLGAINKNSRARVMAALLLSMIDDTVPNTNAKPSVLVGEINAHVASVLTAFGKAEFCPYVEITLPPTQDNHAKFKAALVKTLQELRNLNIRSAMNSGTDVLGKFYEVFLKYGNGAKEIGIVLTPRHITQFAADVLSIHDKDIVFDPTCGTGGFLVAAFDHVKRNSSEVQVERFKQNNLFGVEQEPEVGALAIVNMIFRGDGRTNIVQGDCFQKNLILTSRGRVTTASYVTEQPEPDELAVTKVLMNPPFALKSSDLKEFKFVDYALGQMQDGGLLFAVLPYSTMVKSGEYQTWRTTSLLAKNTLLSVITLPPDLFYPVGVHTVAIIVRKGIPHPPNQSVLWIRALEDGLLKSKGKRLPNQRAKNDYTRIRDSVKSFVANPTMNVSDVEQFIKLCPVNTSDPLLELVPENYLDQAPPSADEVREGMEQVIRDAVAFMIRSRKEGE